jgi:hypothetical protein
MSTLAEPVQLVAVMVAGVPSVELWTSRRLVMEFPIIAKVVQVKLLPLVMVIVSVLVAVPVLVKVAIPVGLPLTV